jgi:hypothetical protein
MELLREGWSWSCWLAVFFGLPAAAAAVTAGALARSDAGVRQSVVGAGLAMAFGAAALVIGLAGFVGARRVTLTAVAHAAPDSRAALTAAGFAEARVAAQVAGVAGGLPLLAGAVLLVAGARRLKGPVAP